MGDAAIDCCRHSPCGGGNRGLNGKGKTPVRTLHEGELTVKPLRVIERVGDFQDKISMAGAHPQSVIAL